MYNKYRTQFAVIHNLEKEICIPKPLIAQLKNKLRYEIYWDGQFISSSHNGAYLREIFEDLTQD